jgi:hypothetical protein
VDQPVEQCVGERGVADGVVLYWFSVNATVVVG